MAFDSYGQPAVRGAGSFQFIVFGVTGVLSDGGVRVFGHHRAGAWEDRQPLELVYRDGVTHRIERARMEPALNAVCELRGQRTLVIYGFRVEQVHRNHWVRARRHAGDHEAVPRRSTATTPTTPTAADSRRPDARA